MDLIILLMETIIVMIINDEKKIDIKNNNTNAFNEVKEYIEKIKCRQ